MFQCLDQCFANAFQCASMFHSIFDNVFLNVLPRRSMFYPMFSAKFRSQTPKQFLHASFKKNIFLFNSEKQIPKHSVEFVPRGNIITSHLHKTFFYWIRKILLPFLEGEEKSFSVKSDVRLHKIFSGLSVKSYSEGNY